MSKIEVLNITKKFSKGRKTKIVALDNVSVTIEDGDFAVIVGPSGCGKTTLLRIISGLVDQDCGEILFNGTCVDGLPSKDRGLSYMSQGFSLYPSMTIYDNIAFPLRLAKLPIDEIERRVNDIAKMFQLEILLSRKPKQLSIGQQQKVALAKALISNPNIILFDEPLANLDVRSRDAFLYELVKLHKKMSATFVYVTHNQKEAFKVATNLIIMDTAKIVEQGRPIDLLNNPKTQFTRDFLCELTLDDR